MSNQYTEWSKILVPSVLAFIAGYGLSSYLEKSKVGPTESPNEEDDEQEEYDEEEDNVDNVEIDDENHYKMVPKACTLTDI